jgi:hypothetical protein
MCDWEAAPDGAAKVTPENAMFALKAIEATDVAVSVGKLQTDA